MGRGQPSQLARCSWACDLAGVLGLLLLRAAEGVALGEGALEALSRVSGGDMRKAITTLQVGALEGAAMRAAICTLGDAQPAHSFLVPLRSPRPVITVPSLAPPPPRPPPLCAQSAVRLRGSPVQPATITDVSGAVPPAVVQGVLAAARSGQFARVQAAVGDLVAEGYPAQEVLLQLQDALLADEQTSDAGGWEGGAGGEAKGSVRQGLRERPLGLGRLRIGLLLASAGMRPSPLLPVAPPSQGTHPVPAVRGG
jgi:hypothetical protein